jgi:hypothetical protein
MRSRADCDDSRRKDINRHFDAIIREIGRRKQDCEPSEYRQTNTPTSPPFLIHFFPHRFAAALAAICDRLRGDSAAALATPPFSPPRRPKATA